MFRGLLSGQFHDRAATASSQVGLTTLPPLVECGAYVV